MKNDNELGSIQINVPHSEYGKCDWFAPRDIQDWLYKYKLTYQFGGSQSGGNDYTDGIPNTIYYYSVKNISETDALAFQLMFPKCKVIMFKKHTIEEQQT